MTLHRALDAHGLGLILDIVPNHMGIVAANPWWRDLLRRGRESRYAGHFDIDFAADPEGKLVLPVLGAALDETLARGELRLTCTGGEPELEHGEQRYPLAAGTDPEAPVEEIVTRQHYRLVHWRAGTAQRNYRRFFNIDQLAGLRMERPEVFEDSHRLILDLARRGLIQGLRIDHVDGLTDPLAYLRRLQQRLAEVRGDPGPFYVVVEKILIGEERLPEEWPVAGTTGYEFANEALGLLVSGPGLQELARVAGRLIGREQDYPAMVAAAKAEVLDKLFAGELAGLARRVAEETSLSPEASVDALRRLLMALPVYRTYADAAGLGAQDRAVLERALAQAAETAEAPGRAMVERLGRALLAPERAALLLGLQQLSGPVMAKSVEDTAFYRYHRLLALNEVGGEADSKGCPPEHFHRRAVDRLRHWPDMLLATATHDTKRGEDARARLAVLSEVPAEWEAAVAEWHRLSEGSAAIHPADEYALYQALVGAWPEDLRPEDEAGVAELAGRLEQWQRKALREGKERSSWDDPDETYEQKAADFLRAALRGPMPAAVAAFVTRIDAAAVGNGLGQLLLKLTTPGVPDIYQGTERRDFSLVDPDNRRPVDFEVLASGANDSSKARVLRRVLAFRAEEPELFARGDYRPLRAEGPLADHVLAFARVRQGQAAIVVITRLLGGARVDSLSPILPPERWRDTAIPVPPDLPSAGWRDVLGEASVEIRDDWLHLAPLLGRLPVAMVAAR